MNPDFRADLPRGVVVVRWRDTDRDHNTNLLLRVGAWIELHSHSYPHDTDLGPGVYEFGNGEQVRTISGPASVHVPTGAKHSFRLLEMVDGAPGKIDCHWPIGADQ